MNIQTIFNVSGKNHTNIVNVSRMTFKSIKKKTEQKYWKKPRIGVKVKE